MRSKLVLQVHLLKRRVDNWESGFLGPSQPSLNVGKGFPGLSLKRASAVLYRTTFPTNKNKNKKKFEKKKKISTTVCRRSPCKDYH